jgi:hypothetical protein
MATCGAHSHGLLLPAALPVVTADRKLLLFVFSSSSSDVVEGGDVMTSSFGSLSLVYVDNDDNIEEAMLLV